MQFDLAIQGDLVLPSGVVKGGWLAIREGRIAGIFSSQEQPEAHRTIDAQGKWVLPGGIDAHVHSGSNKDHPEGLSNMTRSAAAGGLTTVIDMPFDAITGPVTNVSRLKAKIQAIGQEAVIDVALYGSITKRDGTDQILPLADGGVCAFKLSTFEYDPDRFPSIPDDELITAFGLFPKAGRPVAFHAENDEIVNALIKNLRPEGVNSAELHCISHPPIAETTSIAKLLELTRVHPIALHIAHLSVPFGYDMVNHYKSLGVDCTTETNLLYLVFVQEQMEEFKGVAKVNPPLRPRKMMEELWVKLFAGEIDFIISDHAPWSAEQKNNENIFDDRPGIPGVETLLPLFFSEGVARRGLDIQAFARLTAEAPAKRFGLYPTKGALWIGSDADIAILDPGKVWRYDASKSFSTGKLTPVDGMELTGKIETTLVRGEVVFDQGEIVVPEGTGRFTRPAPA